MRFAVLLVALTSACDIVFPLEFFDPIPHVSNGDEDAGDLDLTLPDIGTFLIDTSTDPVTTGGGFDEIPLDIVRQDGTDTDLVVMRVKNLRVEGVLEIIGTRPLVVIAETILVTGTIDASGTGMRPGPGGGRPDMSDPGQGGAGQRIGGLIENHSGGGGGGFGFGGGAGGDVDCSARSLVGGRPGLEIGERFLKVLQGGGAGGRGGFDCLDAESIPGAGGGALQLSALDSITIEGFVLAGGGQGGRADACTSVEGAGSGGGAGGAIYLDAPNISNTGTIAANGGGGGGGGDGGLAGDGEDGFNAKDKVMPSAGGAASGHGTFGGNGAIGGGAGSGFTGTCGGGSQRFNTGGGGGAAGRIVFRGVANPIGTVSPTQEEPPRER